MTGTKVIFFDIDGTLTHHEDGSIPSSTKDAIGELLERGIKVVAATGRPLSMCGKIQDLGIETFITANGGYGTDGDEVIFQSVLSTQTVEAVSSFAMESGHGLSFYTDSFSMNGIEERRTMPALFETLGLKEYPPVVEKMEEEVFLMCLFAGDEPMHLYHKRFPELTFRRWHPFILNVLERDVSKSIAMKKVLDHFGLHPSEAMAFGDGGNDIDMLQLVGMGVAMGNAGAELKSVADFVTKPSGEDGIAFALGELGLISIKARS
ncbi:Cof subfamily protein (haloacid dehalogenase superfamily) [Rossellomorea marisflavi]